MSWLLFFSGLANGFLYAAMALGFTLLFKTARVPNLALGGIGTLIALVTLDIYTGLNLPYWAALLIALAIGLAMGWGIHRLIFSRLKGGSVLVALVTTIGLNFILIGIAQRYWAHGEPYRFPGSPSTQDSLLVKGLSHQHGLILIVTLAMLGVLYAILYRSRLGLDVRAVAEDAETAHIVGLNVKRVHGFSWMLMASLAGIAAVLFAPLLLLDTNVLNLVMYKALGAAVLGGLTSLGGAVVGGIALGVVENMVVPYAPTASEAAAFIVIILILAIRPQGLFGKETIRKI